jgi:hypothetical protein
MYFSIKYFIWSVLVVVLVIFFRLEPINIQESKNIDIEKIPQFSFDNFLFFDLESKVVKTILKGGYGEGFDNGFLRMRDVFIVYQNNKFKETLKANYSFYNDSVMEFKQNVIYRRSDNLNLETISLSYDYNQKIFYVPEEFEMYKNGNFLKGRTLTIDQISGDIKANDIKAVLDTKILEY